MNYLIKVVVLVILLSPFTALASEGFNILSEIEESYNEKISHAIEASNIDKYRLLDRRTILIIDDTIHVELLSVQECNAQGIALSTSSYREGAPIYNGGKFYLDPSGILIEKKTPQSTKTN